MYLMYLLKSYGYAYRALKYLEQFNSDKELSGIYDITGVYIGNQTECKNKMSIIYENDNNDLNISINHKNILYTKELYKNSKNINKFKFTSKLSYLEIQYMSTFITSCIISYYNIKLYGYNDIEDVNILALKKTINKMVDDERLLPFIDLTLILCRCNKYSAKKIDIEYVSDIHLHKYKYNFDINDKEIFIKSIKEFKDMVNEL